MGSECKDDQILLSMKLYLDLCPRALIGTCIHTRPVHTRGYASIFVPVTVFLLALHLSPSVSPISVVLHVSSLHEQGRNVPNKSST